ncbi:MAG: response regulator [Desulfobacteraceae bacterium]|nr:response regulator [Desulfobacteraceae bacterium]
MKKQCNNDENDILEKLIGLGSSSIQKSYYPQLRKKIEELENEKRKYQSFFNNAFNGILRVDRNGLISEANPSVIRMTGFENFSHGLEGKNLRNDLMSYPGQWDSILESLDRNQAVKNCQIKLKTQDGKKISVSANILKSEQNESIIEIFCENISEKQRMEEELAHMQKMDALGQLAAGTAHDFNNILTGIMGSCELLNGHVDKNFEKFLNTISYSAERAAALISKLLTFSRKGEIHLQNINIHRIVENTVEILERSIDRKVLINTDLHAQKYTISGDESLIQNALLNLGINAKDAMTDGGLLFFKTKNTIITQDSIRYLPYEINPGTYLEIEIRDTGNGIPGEIIPKIFDPFFTTKEKGKGSGLGLSSVYGTIKKHKGIITVYSEPHSGTSFIILLPLSDPEKTEKTSEKAQLFTGKGNILLADDDEIITTTSSALIESLGYSVVNAENGFEALKIYKKNPKRFDIVILDMIMPLMDGRDCFFEIKKINPDAKIIISSGFSKHTEIEKLSENGLCGFIKKPFEKSELSKVIHYALS